MNNRRLLYIIFIGLFLILGLQGGIWFFENFEYKEVENTSNYSLKARINQYLAAEYYLRKTGLDVESDGSRNQLLATHTRNETIFVNDYGPKLSPTRFIKLKKWIENGGHLIMTANKYNNEPTDKDVKDKFNNNQLLAEYSIVPSYTKFDNETPYPGDDLVSKYMLKDKTEISIIFYPDYHLVDTKNLAQFTLQDEYGIHLLQLKIGNGILTILSDDYFLENYGIGDHDHAYLIWKLATANKSTNSKIWLLYTNASDSIFTILWKNAKHAIITFIVLIIIGIWAMQGRFGPIIPLNDVSSRNILEHLSALARFSWRQDKGKRLLHQSRITCEQTLISRYPVLKNMSVPKRIEHLADVLDMTPKTIEQALYTEPKSTNEYITSSHHLQKLWVAQ